MPKLRFHLLGLSHIETNRNNMSCAYTQKIIKFAKMIKKYGHTIYFYGVEGSEVECDEFIQVSTNEILLKAYGNYDKTKDFFKHDPDDIANLTFNQNTISEILKRKEPKDILLCTLGNYQKPIADKVNLVTVESGIGYTGILANFRIFESYAWMHHVYGLFKIEDGAWYDAVIPNYFDLEDFPYKEDKQDYLLYFGRIIGRKGVRIASDVAKATGHKLYVVGQGSLDDLNEGLNLGGEKHIFYMPAVGAEERAGLLSNAKAVLMPTYYLEPFGGVNVEAQLCGTPVITSDWGAFSETVLHGTTGYRCRTFEEFCWAVNNISNIKPYKCRQWAEKNYSMDRVGEMYEEYFQRIYKLFNKGWYEKNDGRINLNWLKKYYPFED